MVRPLESSVQEKIIKSLEKNGWYVVKIITCTKNGWPDLQALKKKRIVFIEVKRPGEGPDPLQEYRHKELKELGFEVIPCAQSLDCVKHLIN